MPVRTSVSPLEAAIIPQVRSYLKSRSDELASVKADDPEKAVNDGIDMITDAISIAVNAALSSPAMQGTFAAILDTNATAVIPIGQTAYSAVMAPATIPSAPNPLSVPI